MKAKGAFFLRKFLNRKGIHSNAFIFAEITKSVHKDKKGKETVWHETELKIADCDRIVSLSMDLHTPRLAANSLYKIDVLISSLQAFRKAFANEAEQKKRKQHK